MREGYPFGLFAVPRKEIVEVHTSSGTTGKPTVSGYTRKDIEIWGEVVARALTMCGATKDDIIQNGYGYGLFTGGLGVHYGAQRIGATVVPVSAGQTKRHLDIMQDFRLHHPHLHPFLRTVSDRSSRRSRHKYKEIKTQGGMLRRRDVDGQDAG